MERMQVVLDEHVKSVLEFMQTNIPATKLVAVADSLPQMAKLLWAQLSQEPVTPMALQPTKRNTSQSNAPEGGVQ